MPVPAKVLVVDDEAHVRMYVRMMVQDLLPDAQVLEAPDARTATALFLAHRPALVLLDVNLVGPSGLELLPELRTINPDAVIVMLTAVNARRVVESAADQGAGDYLLKDVSHEELRESLRAVIRQHFGDEEPMVE